MKIKHVYLIMALSLMLPAIAGASLAADDFKYEVRGRRDPFVPLIGQEKVSYVKLEDVSSAEEVKLEGIAAVGKGNMTAMLNGEILKEKDRVGGVEVKKINKESVIISIDGKDHTLSLYQEGGAKE